MKRLIFICMILMLLLVVAAPGAARGQTGPTWSSVIQYFVPKDDTYTESDNLSVIFYDKTTQQQAGSQSDIPLTLHQSGQLLVGETLEGSAVVSATKPIMAVYKQDVSGDNYSPILYTSFDAAQAGNGKYYIPTVQKNVSSYTSLIGIQNVESLDLTVNLTFYDTGTNTYSPAAYQTKTIKSQSSILVDVSTISELPDGFSGSLVIDASRGTSSSPARVVAAVQEVLSGGRRAYAFEGVGAGASAVFMPTAMCNFGRNRQTTYYAIQNTGTGPAASVTVTYYNSDGSFAGSNVIATPVATGRKTSVSACTVTSGSTARRLLTAVVSSTGAPVAAIGKLTSRDGLATAFTGQAAPAGSLKVALPYVEWSAALTGYRTFIAIMNVTGSELDNVRIQYFAPDGGLTATQDLGPIPAYSKRNSDPYTAGALTDGSYNGAVTIGCGTSEPYACSGSLAVLVRVQKGVRGIRGLSVLGDDYNGIPFAP